MFLVSYQTVLQFFVQDFLRLFRKVYWLVHERVVLLECRQQTVLYIGLFVYCLFQFWYNFLACCVRTL